MITQDKQLILLGSNHLPTVFLKTTLTQTITLDKQLTILGSNHLPNRLTGFNQTNSIIFFATKSAPGSSFNYKMHGIIGLQKNKVLLWKYENLSWVAQHINIGKYRGKWTLHLYSFLCELQFHSLIYLIFIFNLLILLNFIEFYWIQFLQAETLQRTVQLQRVH